CTFDARWRQSVGHGGDDHLRPGARPDGGGAAARAEPCLYPIRSGDGPRHAAAFRWPRIGGGKLMLRFLLMRILSAIPTMLIVTVAIFALMRMIPGDPAVLMLGDMAQPGQVEDLRQRMGLDQPLPVQFVTWLGNVLSGDFGKSTATGE